MVGLELPANERIALQGLDRHPLRTHLQSFGGLDRTGRENVDLPLELVAVRKLHRGHFRRADCLPEFTAETRQVVRIVRVDADHRNAQMLGQVIEFNLDVAVPRDVHHRDDKHHRHFQFAQKQRQVQVALQRRRIKHIDVEIGLMAQKILQRCPLVLARRRQRVYPRQIDNLNLFAFTFDLHLKPGNARLLLHCDAGPVADMLVRARQGVEDRRLPAIWIPDKPDCLHCHHEIFNAETRRHRVFRALSVPLRLCV